MPTAAVIATSRWAIPGLIAALVLRPVAIGAWQASGDWLRWLDELGLAALLLAAVWVRWRGLGRRLSGERALAVAVLVFSATAALSSIVNGVEAPVAVLGTADYIKALGFVFVGATFDAPVLRRRFFFTLSALGWVAAIFALGESLFLNVIADGAGVIEDVLGVRLVKPRGLLGHANINGLFIALALIVSIAVGRAGKSTIVAHWLACTASLSRMLHIIMIVVLAAASQKRRWVLVPVGISLVFLVLSYQRTAWELDYTYKPTTEELPYHYRTFARHRALEVLRDHPMLGAGPGRFGGVVSVIYGSPLYEQYTFPAPHGDLLRSFRSLDSFYPQLLAELGVLGALAWGGLGGLLLWLLWRRRRDEPWARAGTLAIVATAIYCLGSGLNISSFLSPAMVIAGFGLAVDGGRGSVEEPEPSPVEGES